MDSYAVKFFIIIFCSLHASISPASAYKFQFRIQPKDQISIESSTVIFRCSAVSEPARTIVYLWKRNGKYIDMINNKRFETRLAGDLVITSVTQDDFGNDYQCVAQCANGAIISQSAKLKKAQLSYHDTPSKSQILLKEGAYLLLKPPRLTSTPSASFRWELCNSQHQCTVPDPSRSFVTSEGNLLISPILHSSENGKIPRVFIRVKYFNERNFIYGSITVTDQLKVAGAKSCPDFTVTHLPTKTNFTVYEGQNVSLDCLPILKRCRSTLSIKWMDENMTPRSSTRRLLLTNVTKQDESVYRCTPNDIGSYTASYYLYVVEKPRIVKEPLRVVDLGYDGIVPGGAASNVDSIDWYRNAERIPSNSNSFQITTNRSLVLRHWSSSLAGLYQIIYRNKAGTLSRTVRVDIPTGISGDKITTNSGEINFLRQDLPKGIIYFRWLIQTFSTAKLKLYFTDFLLNGANQNTFVRLDRGLSYKYHFNDVSKPRGILEIAGPYIVVAVYGNGTQLAKHGFKLLYGYNVTVPTTSVATRTRSQSSIPTTQKTIITKQRPSTTAATAGRFTTISGYSTRKNTILSTTNNARKPDSKQPKRTSTSDLTTTAAATTERLKVSVSPPKKRDNINRKGSNATLFVGIGSSMAVIIIIVAGVFCYRRRHPKFDFKISVSKERALSDACSSANDGSSRTDRSSLATETCFTVQGNQGQASNMVRNSHTMPDIIPSNEPNFYELGYIGPCNDPPTDEHYTSLKFNNGTTSHYEETYTALRFDDVNKREHRPEVHPYAVVVPEEKNNHYMRADSAGSKDSKPASTCPIYAEYERVGQQSAISRLDIQSLPENQDPMPTVPIKRCVSESKLPRSIQNNAASQPLYHVLESNSVTDTKSGYSYCYVGLSKNKHDKANPRPYQQSPTDHHMPTVPVKRCTSDYGLSTAAKDIPAENASQPLYHVLECNSATGTKGSNSSFNDGLSPNACDTQQGYLPQPFYHVLENIVPNKSKTDVPYHKNVGYKSQTKELYLEPCPTPPKTHEKPGQPQQQQQQQRQQRQQRAGIEESPAEYHTANYIQPNQVQPSIVAIKQSPQMQSKGLQTKVSDGLVYMPSRSENEDQPVKNDANDLPLYQSLSSDGLYATVKY